MSDMIVQALSAKEAAEGVKEKHMFWASPDSPPWPDVPNGPDGARGYRFTQGEPAEVWVIEHGLGFYPQITVQNTIGQEQLAVVTFVSLDEVSIRFSEPCAGDARLGPEEV